MNTRQKILETAKHLFNEQGLEAVSLRAISKEIGISHGNLRYHFEGKGPLVATLLDECLNQNTQFIEELMISGISIENLYKLTVRAANEAWEYRFLTRDLGHRAEQFPEVHQRLLENYARRKREFQVLLEVMVQQGMFKPERYDGQYQQLVDQLMINVEFGFANIMIYYPGNDQDQILKYQHTLFSLLIPYFNEPFDEELLHLMGASSD